MIMAANDVQTRAKSFEEISDENMLDFFKSEIALIEKGARPRGLLPDGVFKRFRSMGLFKKRFSRREWESIRRSSG